MGLLAGTGLNYAPKSSTTRAEATAIVNRLMGYVERVDAQKAEQERLAAEKAKQQQQTQTSVTPTTFDTPSNTGFELVSPEDAMNGVEGVLDLSQGGIDNNPADAPTFYGG